MKNTRSLSMLLFLVAIAAYANEPGNPADAKPTVSPMPLTMAPGKMIPLPRVVIEEAQAALNAGLPDVAMDQLDGVDPNQFDANYQLQWHTLRAAIYTLQGKLLDAVRERVAVDALLTAQPARRRNQEAILEALALIPPDRLTGYPLLAEDLLSGWLALGVMLTAHDAPDIQAQKLAQWHHDYPDHPADGDLIRAALARQPATKPKTTVSLAALLPNTGVSAVYGDAIRQGITAAYADDKTPAKPTLRFYDSETGDVTAVYHQALTEGAEVVIGPLRKDQVAALLKADDLSKPVLALNQVDGQREDFYQFSLLPEDELDQVADRAWQDGRRNALLLVQAKSYGQRMSSHFNDYWSHLGGRVVAVQTYASGENDFAVPIKKLLRVDEPSAEHPPVPRIDADVIFLIAEARDARMLTPQLRYYGATKLPIYATAMVYSGRPNRSQDQDLAGVVFCDAPWLLGEGSTGQRLPIGSSVTNPRLWAMGVDAYRLSRQLKALQSAKTPYDGASGSLSLQSGNRIHRQLQCAHFEGGLPVLHNHAPPVTAEQVPH